MDGRVPSRPHIGTRRRRTLAALRAVPCAGLREALHGVRREKGVSEAVLVVGEREIEDRTQEPHRKICVGLPARLAQFRMTLDHEVLGDRGEGALTPPREGDFQEPAVVVEGAGFEVLTGALEILKRPLERHLGKPRVLALGKRVHAEGNLADELQGFLADLLDSELAEPPRGEAFDLALDAPLDDEGLGALCGDA